jgi:hypothetical protein
MSRSRALAREIAASGRAGAAAPLLVSFAAPPGIEGAMARSKSKQKIKRHQRKQKRSRRIKRKKTAEAER